MKQTSPKVCTITSEWLRMSKRTDTGNGISVARSSKTALMKPSMSSTDRGVKAWATSRRRRPWPGSSTHTMEWPTSLISSGAKRPPKPNRGGWADARGSFEKRESLRRRSTSS